MLFAPVTLALTSKCSGVCVGPLTPSSALASPLPTLEAFGQAAGPPDSSAASEHFVRPFALSLNVFGALISSFASVFFGSLFLMFRSIDEFFGFFFVPAFLGA